MCDKKTKVLAVSSGGGHWAQLLCLRPAFTDCDVVFATGKAGIYLAAIGVVFVALEALTDWLPVVVGSVALMWSLTRSPRALLRLFALDHLSPLTLRMAADTRSRRIG